MLTIRRAQLSVFEQDSMARFEAALMQHLRRAWPRECRLAGSDEQLLLAVRRMVKRARTHGYTTERQLTLFALCVVSLGMGFDNDPQFAWAADALTNEALEDPTQRIEALYDEMVAYLGAVGGDDSERVVRALLRVRRHDFALTPWAAHPDAPVGDTELEALCDLLGGFWPEKMQFQGPLATLAMARDATRRAARYGINQASGLGAFVTLAYFLGLEFDADPWHPWAQELLRQPLAGCERGDQLVQAGLQRLAASLTPR